MASYHTPVGMLSFPHLFVPRPRSPGGEPVFSLSLVFDQAAQKDPLFKALRQAVAETIDNEWGPGKSKDASLVSRLRLPFRKAEEKSYAGYEPGKIFISAWTKNKPGLVDGRLQEIHAASDVFAGQLARASVAPFAYKQSGNQGVSFMLNNVMIVKKDMPRMDGRKAAADDFDQWLDETAGASGNANQREEEEALF